MAPSVDVIPHAQHFGFDNRPACFLGSKIGARQEHLPNRHQFVHPRFVTRAANLIIEKLCRDLHMNARAVAGFAVGIDRPTVPDGLEGVDPVFDNFARGGAVD